MFYILARIKRVLDEDQGWDKEFWKTANWTVVFVCPFDVTGPEGDGRISFNIQAKYGSQSADGSIWSFNNREGIALKNSGKYFKVAVDTPQGIIQWEVGLRQYTCEVGIIPQQHFTLAECLYDNYGDNIRTFLKTPEEKYPEIFGQD